MAGDHPMGFEAGMHSCVISADLMTKSLIPIMKGKWTVPFTVVVHMAPKLRPLL